MHDIDAFREDTAIDKGVTRTVSTEYFLPYFIVDDITIGHLEVDVQCITGGIREDFQCALDAVDAYHSDFDGGEGGQGLLSVSTDGHDAIGVSANVDELCEGGLVLC